MNTYMPCPNNCTGEVPMGCDEEPADYEVGIMGPSVSTYVDEKANATSHDDGCPPLTPEQVFALQEAADAKVNDPKYGYWDRDVEL